MCCGTIMRDMKLPSVRNLELLGIRFFIWAKSTSVTNCTGPSPPPTQGLLNCCFLLPQG